MHKRIVKAIELAITQDDRGEKIKIFIDSKPTDGFWSMCIIPPKKEWLSHIEAVGVQIGRFYGEGLNVEKKAGYIVFS